MTTTSTYAVSGMSCQHCIDAVTKEVSAIVGVTTVAVDLAEATVTVTSEAPLEVETVRVAVDEAGFDLAPAEG